MRANETFLLKSFYARRRRTYVPFVAFSLVVVEFYKYAAQMLLILIFLRQTREKLSRGNLSCNIIITLVVIILRAAVVYKRRFIRTRAEYAPIFSRCTPLPYTVQY